MSKKFYAVRKGLIPGIYESWKECWDNVENVSGAEYKSFTNKEDAKAYLLGNNKSIIPEINETDSAVAYLGGSYTPKSQHVGYAITLITQNKEINIYGRIGFCNKNGTKLHAGMGEIKSVLKLIEYCESNNIKSVIIYYGNQLVISQQHKNVGDDGFSLFKQYYDVIHSTKVNLVFDKLSSYEKHHYKERAEKNAKAGLLVEREQKRSCNKT